MLITIVVNDGLDTHASRARSLMIDTANTNTDFEHNLKVVHEAIEQAQVRILDNIRFLIAASEKYYLRDIGDLDSIQEINSRNYGLNKLQHCDYYLRVLSTEVSKENVGLDAEPAFKKLLVELDTLNDRTVPNPRYFGESASLGSGISTTPHLKRTYLQFGLFRENEKTGGTHCYGLIGFQVNVELWDEDLLDESDFTFNAGLRLEMVYIHPKLRGLGLGKSMGVASGSIVNKIMTQELVSYNVATKDVNFGSNTFTFSCDYVSIGGERTADTFSLNISDFIETNIQGWEYENDVGY